MENDELNKLFEQIKKDSFSACLNIINACKTKVNSLQIDDVYKQEFINYCESNLEPQIILLFNKIKDPS
jgi:hypothetical protein